jgi:TldD protein
MKKAPNKVNVFPQKAECTKLLNIALKTGADFAELFFESKNEVVYNVYSTANEPTMVFTSGQISGVGVRIIKENEEIYGSINEYSLAKLEKFVKDLADSFVGKQNTKPLPLGDSKPYVKAYEKLASKDDIKPVLDVLYASCKEMKKHSEFITQATASFTSSEQTVLIVNSNGIYQEDERVRSRLRFSCQAVNGEKNSSVGEAPGKSCGLELIDKVD